MFVMTPSLWVFFPRDVLRYSVPSAVMALIDCLSVINGHMLNMHILDSLTQMWKAI